MSDNYKSITEDGGWQIWEGDHFDSCFTGFANRDKFNTESSARIPFNLNVVGEPWNDHFRTKLAEGEFTTYADASTPPIMVLTLTPVVAATKHLSGGQGEVETIDTDAWQVLFRDLNYINRVYNIQFEAISLQYCNFVLSEVVSHVANLLRVMDFAHLEENPNSLIARPNNMMKACGFVGLYEHYSEIVDFINTQIIARLNSRIWFWKFMPSMFRRAAIFSKIYSAEDTSKYDCELYMLKPDCIYMPGYDEETGTFKATRTSISTNVVGYAKQIRDMISWLLADDDFVNIQTAMQAILEKDKTLANGIELTSGEFAYYPRSGRTVFTTYSAGMLTAIHNATVCNGVYPSDIIEVVGSGSTPNRLEQTFTLDDNYYNPAAGHTSWQSLEIMCFNEWIRSKSFFDMPKMIKAEDWQTFVYMSMWHVTSYPEQPIAEMEMSPKCLGTDYIRAMYIYTFTSRDSAPQEVEYGGIMPLIYMNSASQPINVTVAYMRRLCLLAQFAYAPLIPVLIIEESDYYNPKLVGFMNDTQHLAIADFHTLESIKKQFVYNAIGYPMQVSETGEFLGAKTLADQVASNTSAAVTESPLRGDGTSKSSRRAQKSGGEE